MFRTLAFLILKKNILKNILLDVFYLNNQEFLRYILYYFQIKFLLLFLILFFCI